MRELKMEERGAMGVIIGIAAVLLLAYWPAGIINQSLQTFGFVNTLMASLVIVALVSFAMAWFWPKIRVGHQAIIILAFLAIGIFLGFPAFTALGLVALVLTAHCFRHSRVKAKK